MYYKMVKSVVELATNHRNYKSLKLLTYDLLSNSFKIAIFLNLTLLGNTSKVYAQSSPNEIHCGDVLGNRPSAYGINIAKFRDGDIDTYAFQLICTNGRESNITSFAGDTYGGVEYRDSATCRGGSYIKTIYYDKYRVAKGDYDNYWFTIVCSNKDTLYAGSKTGNFDSNASGGISCGGKPITGLQVVLHRSGRDSEWYTLYPVC